MTKQVRLTSFSSIYFLFIKNETGYVTKREVEIVIHLTIESATSFTFFLFTYLKQSLKISFYLFLEFKKYFLIA